jgi:predicted ribosomally synthesized peptide with nif11-like leader
MTKQEVGRLFKDVQINPQLREHLNSAPDLETFVQMATAKGYNFTLEEWRETRGFVVEELKCKVSEIPGI